MYIISLNFKLPFILGQEAVGSLTRADGTMAVCGSSSLVTFCTANSVLVPALSMDDACGAVSDLLKPKDVGVENQLSKIQKQSISFRVSIIYPPHWSLEYWWL